MKTVWIVEDNPLLSSVYRACFGAAGYRVEVFADGEAACARLNGPPPDVVLLDLHLPKVLGLDVLKAIRASPATEAVPVIVLSNSYSGPQLEEVWAAGATHVLPKATCTPRQVLELVRAALPGTKETVT